MQCIIQGKPRRIEDAPHRCAAPRNDLFSVKVCMEQQERSMTARGTEPDPRQLGRLLKEAGSALDPDGVAALIAGILAAPPEIGTSWHRLVAAPTPPALADALEAMRSRLAEDFHDGLADEDFALLPRAARLKMLRDELKAQRLG